MDVKSYADAIEVFLSALGAFLLVIRQIEKGRKDAELRDAEEKRLEADRKQDWEEFIMKQVKDNAEDSVENVRTQLADLQKEFDTLKSEKEQMETQLKNQIALLTEENTRLKQKYEKKQED